MNALRGVVIETPRLRLRELTCSDAAFLVALLNDPDFLHNIGDRGVRSEADARHYLDVGPFASYAAHGFGLWCVERADTAEPLGLCGLLRRDTLPHPDVGYALLPHARGQGLAREAVESVLAYARTALGMDTVVAIVSPANERSMRLLATLGYRKTELVTAAPGADPVWLFFPTTPPNSTIPGSPVTEGTRGR
ncbi:GNAT family N-acetyltransferase [Gemmatimonas sp.]